MLVNDSNVELKSPMIEKNKKVYLPFSNMGIVYDLEFEYSEPNKRVIADSVSKEKSKALSLGKYRLKEKPSMFSKKTDKLENGEDLIVIEKSGKYCKVRSSKGEVGYIKEKKISDIEKVRDNWEVPQIDVNILKDASDINKNYSNVKLDENKTNVVTPTFFYIEHEFQGVNINFEKIDDINSFNRFIIELTPRLKELGLKVSIKTNKNVDEEKLKDVVDIIIK